MSQEDRRAGTCNLSPGPMTCLSCPFPECTNNRPPVRGEDGVENYVNLTDGAKEKNTMQTKYSVGDTVLVEAKVVKIEADKKGVKYILSSEYWTGQNCVREEKIISKSSKKAPKTLAKNEKTLAKTEKTSKNGRKTAENEKELQKTEESKEKQQGSAEGAKAAKRQQERKRPGRPSKKEEGETTNKTTTEGLSAYGKELAKELADSTK